MNLGVKPAILMLAIWLAAAGAAIGADDVKVPYLCVQHRDESDVAPYQVLAWINYATETATATDVNSNQPISDMDAQRWQPISVNGSIVTWAFWFTDHTTEQLIARRYRLDRTTGELYIYEDVTRHGDHFTCKVDGALYFPD